MIRFIIKIIAAIEHAMLHFKKNQVVLNLVFPISSHHDMCRFE